MSKLTILKVNLPGSDVEIYLKLSDTPVTGRAVEPSAPKKSNASDLEVARAPSFSENNGNVAPVQP